MVSLYKGQAIALHRLGNELSEVHRVYSRKMWLMSGQISHGTANKMYFTAFDLQVQHCLLSMFDLGAIPECWMQ